MISLSSEAIPYIGVLVGMVGAFVGFTGAMVGIFNSRMAVRWKRTELANSYMRDFNNSPELVFAGRCLDWNGGKLVLPESVRPYLEDDAKFIIHDRRVFAKALRPDLLVEEMDEDPRIQIYRTSIDGFLSWLALVASALDRRLFLVEDIQDVGYWAAKLQSEPIVYGFIVAFGYKESIDKLINFFRKKNSPYRYWFFPINLPRGQA